MNKQINKQTKPYQSPRSNSRFKVEPILYNWVHVSLSTAVETKSKNYDLISLKSQPIQSIKICTKRTPISWFQFFPWSLSNQVISQYYSGTLSSTENLN